MCCFKRTVNALKTNKYFITNGKKWFAENEQLSDTIREMQLHIAELENKFKAPEPVEAIARDDQVD
jgi:cell division protein FtsB